MTEICEEEIEESEMGNVDFENFAGGYKFSRKMSKITNTPPKKDNFDI